MNKKVMVVAWFFGTPTPYIYMHESWADAQGAVNELIRDHACRVEITVMP